jgi:CheY-like chemotaxis protein
MPHATAAARRIGADDSARRPPARRTVLSVDDRGVHRYARARALRAAGFEVIEDAGGAEALRLAAERQPSLVLLDVHLPDIDGIDPRRWPSP